MYVARSQTVITLDIVATSAREPTYLALLIPDTFKTSDDIGFFNTSLITMPK
jgi:hypothetical protein